MFGRKSITLLAISIDNVPVITCLEPVWKFQENLAKNEEINVTFQEDLVSLSTYDQILEQHPLLDKIVEMLLKYLYSWLMVVNSSLK
jgi:hypothetical protein